MANENKRDEQGNEISPEEYEESLTMTERNFGWFAGQANPIDALIWYASARSGAALGLRTSWLTGNMAKKELGMLRTWMGQSSNIVQHQRIFWIM